MGIFSSKKKHYVDTQIQRMISDPDVPDPAAESMISSILRESDLFDTMMNRALSSPALKFESYYRYADTGITRDVLDANGDPTYDTNGDPITEVDKYYFGLPDTILHTASDGNAEAEAQLVAEVGNAVDIEYLYFRPLNNVHAGLKYITENLGYAHGTNILSTQTTANGFDTYLEKIVAVHQTTPGQEPETTALGTMDSDSQVGESPEVSLWDDPSQLTKLVVQSEVLIGESFTESCQIHTIWEDDDGETQREVINVDLSSYDTDREYYQAKYRDLSDGSMQYWIYDTEAGSNTALNNTFNPPAVIDPGTYYPFVMFRSEGENRADPSRHNTDEFKTTQKLLDELGIDFIETSEALHDEDNDMDDIDQAVLMMAVPITTEDYVETDYLFRWLTDLYGKLPNDAIAKYGSAPGFSTGPYGGYGGSQNSYAITFTDADFDLKVSLESLTYSIKVGNCSTKRDETNQIIPAKVGQCDNSVTTTDYSNQAIFGVGVGSRTIPTGVQKPLVRYVRKQLSEDLYAEFVVTDIKARYTIYKDKGAEAGHNDERLLIPLDRDIVRSMSSFDQEVLLYRSMQWVFNSHVVQKVKWYERGVFKALLTVLAVVITIMTGGTGAALLAAAAQGAVALVTFVINQIIIPMIINMVLFQITLVAVAKVLGPEVALVLAVIAAAVGLAKGFASGSLVKGTAANLLKASTSIAKAASKVLQDEISALGKDWAEFAEMAEEKWEELREIQKTLDSGIDINPFEFIGEEPLFIAGETTDEYFQRTIHNGNPGVMSLEIIENYHQVSLMLPTIQETTLELI